MAQEDVRLSGTFLDSTGQALVGKTVTLFAEGTTTPPLATDTTDSAGEWAFNDGGSSNGLTPDQIYEVPGRYDVQLVTGAETLRILARDKFQVTELQSRNPTSLTQPAGIFTNTYTNGGAAAAGLAAIYSFRPATESTGVESAVAGVNGSSVYNDFQLTNSASTPEDFIAGRLAFEAVDVANGSEDSKLNLWTMKAGTLTEVLHLDGTSLHPETTDVVSLGTSALNFSDLFLDSGAVVNFDSGNLTLTHSAGLLTVSGGLTVSGTTTLNGALILGDAAADTLTVNATIQGATPLVFEGASAGLHETSFAIANPSADRTITFPDATLTVNAAANISGTTLASNVVTSSLTTVGALGSGSIGTGFGVINNNAAITGTTVTGSTAIVGGTVAGTTGTFSGVVDITDTTDASDATGDTGALRTEGGASIAAKLYVGTDLSVDGTSNLDDTDIDGTLVVDGSNISLDSTATLNIDNSNTSNGISIGTATASVPINIGHGTSLVTIGDNLTVTGDLTVSGDTTTVTSTTVAIADSLLLLAKDQGTSADAVDFGLYGKYGVGGTAKYAGIFRDGSATGDPWTFFDGNQAEPGTTVNVGGTGYDLADISAGGITAADGFTGDLTGDVTGNADTVTTNANLTGDVTSSGSNATAIAAGVIIDNDVNASAAIAYSKLAALASGNILVGNGSNVAVSVNPSGDVDITNAGVFSIASDSIINADIKSDAAIADSKLATISTADKVSGAAIQVDGATDGTAITIAAADKFLIDDAGTTKYVTASQINTYVGDSDTTYSPGALLDLSGTTFAVDLTEAAAATVAAADYVLFLDGGTTGTQSKGNIHDVATLFAGAGMTATSSVMNVIGGTGITANADDIAIDSTVMTLAGVQTITGTKTLNGTSSTPAIALLNAVETTTITASVPPSTVNFDVATQSVLIYTTAANATWITNLRFSSGTSLNTALATGQSVSITLMAVQGGTAYLGVVFKIDGTTVTPLWQEGIPTSAGASGTDVYTFTVTKTANATYRVIASMTSFK
jgi:hypothetical protein